MFSIVFQAISQGFFPRFHITHTSNTVSKALLGLSVTDPPCRDIAPCMAAAATASPARDRHHCFLEQHAATFRKLLQVFGQVYIPVVNYVVMALTLVVVGTFQSSEHMGQAYGEL